MSQFQLRDVCQFAAHQENTRLMGFVVEGRDWSEGDEEGKPSFSAFVFESNTEGEKVGALNAQRTSQLLLHRLRLKHFFLFVFRYVTP